MLWVTLIMAAVSLCSRGCSPTRSNPPPQLSVSGWPGAEVNSLLNCYCRPLGAQLEADLGHTLMPGGSSPPFSWRSSVFYFLWCVSIHCLVEGRALLWCHSSIGSCIVFRMKVCVMSVHRHAALKGDRHCYSFVLLVVIMLWWTLRGWCLSTTTEVIRSPSLLRFGVSASIIIIVACGHNIVVN